LLANVIQNNIIACQCGDMCNAISHLARANDADLFDIHASGSQFACLATLSVALGQTQGCTPGILGEI
jgi:hypothetical protein